MPKSVMSILCSIRCLVICLLMLAGSRVAIKHAKCFSFGIVFQFLHRNVPFSALTNAHVTDYSVLSLKIYNKA